MKENQHVPLAECVVGEPSDGIVLARGNAEATVWDREADADSIHAAVSAESEDAERRKSAPQIAEISRHIDGSTVILDLGCGYGRIAKYLLPRREIGGYIGVDSSIQMLKLFKDRYDRSAAEQRTPALFVNSDIAALPVKDGSIDLVVVSAVFLHNHKPIVRQAIDEVWRVLKPGGKLLVFSSFPRRETLMGVQGTLYHALLRAKGEAERNGPVRYYSRGEMNRLLGRFAHVELRGHGFTLLPKSIIGLKGAPERLFRRGFAEPINRIVASILPKSWAPAFAVHYDVFGVK